jgi:hypothetical protein
MKAKSRGIPKKMGNVLAMSPQRDVRDYSIARALTPVRFQRDGRPFP